MQNKAVSLVSKLPRLPSISDSKLEALTLERFAAHSFYHKEILHQTCFMLKRSSDQFHKDKLKTSNGGANLSGTEHSWQKKHFSI